MWEANGIWFFNDGKLVGSTRREYEAQGIAHQLNRIPLLEKEIEWLREHGPIRASDGENSFEA